MHKTYSSRLNSMPIILSLSLGLQFYGTSSFAQSASHIVVPVVHNVACGAGHANLPILHTTQTAPQVNHQNYATPTKISGVVVNVALPQHVGAVLNGTGSLVLQHGQSIDFSCSHNPVATVLHRDAQLSKLIKEDAGDLSGKYTNLTAQVNAIRSQEQCDASHNGGKLTGAEFNHLMSAENSLARQIARDNNGAGDAAFQANHPLRSEVLGRDAHLSNLIKEDAGDLSGKYTLLMSSDNSIRSQEQSDAAKNGGHLTLAEYSQLNKEENNLAKQIAKDNSGAGDAAFKAAHPLRSEVLGRDAHFAKLIKEDAGDLSGKYNQLKAADNSIRSQEQSDAAKNGGHLTLAEYSQLNKEENNLAKQISKDNNGAGDAAFRAAHPLRSEVLGRDAHLATLIKEDAGDLSGKYTLLKAADNAIRSQEQSDAAKNGGHLTIAEYRQLNKEENHLAKQIAKDNNGAGDAAFRAAHPLRSEVLGRDARLGQLIKEDAGALSGKYNQLMAADNSIRSQEQHDAAKNGGVLSAAEYAQLNKEENSLAGQIAKDNSGAGDAAFQSAHPLRSEVLGRDSSLLGTINQDKGKLDGQYGELKGMAIAIKTQEQQEAASNGGFLTTQQAIQLNCKETDLEKKIEQSIIQ